MNNRGIGNPLKRLRQDQKDDEELESSSNARQLMVASNRLDEAFGTQGQHSLNQQQLLQGSFPTQPNIASETLLNAGNYPLLNPNGTTLRNLSVPDPFSNIPFLSSASQSLGNYNIDPFTTQTGLFDQGLWSNHSAQTQAQAQAQAEASSPAPRGRMMQGQASQLPNFLISVPVPASLAIPPEARLSSEQPVTGNRGISFGNESSTSSGAVRKTQLTGRPPVVLYMPCDDAVISRYQCLARQQMELFEAQEIDVEAGAQGRNRGIVLGQVGIRCRHCSHLYPRRRTKSSTFYPSKLKSIYQTAQNMANTHLTQTCQYIPQETRDELLKLSQDKKTSAGGGKTYWSDGARILGVYETETLLRFSLHTNYPGSRSSDERTPSLVL